MKRVQFNNFEQLTQDDLNNIGIFEISTNSKNIVQQCISGTRALLTEGFIVSHVSGDLLRVASGRGFTADGNFLVNDNSSFDLLATNALYDMTGGVPADVADGFYFLVEAQAFEADGAVQVRNFIDPNGNTYSQATVKEKVMGIKARIKVGNAIQAPAVDTGWTKLAEVKKITAGSYTVYPVSSYFDSNNSVYDNTGWTNEKRATTRLRTFGEHRSRIPADHPNGSIIEDHLDAVLKAKINAGGGGSAGGGVYKENIRINLLNKGAGQARDNKSMEYFFGTGLDADYFMTKRLTDEYDDQLLNDDTDATTIDQYSVNNPSTPQVMSNLQCDISDTTLFDIFMTDGIGGDIVPVMTGNTLPSGACFAFAPVGAGSGTEWHMFDKNDGTEWDSGTILATDQILGYISSTPAVVSKITVRTGGDVTFPFTVGQIQGSNDTTNGVDGTWTTIDAPAVVLSSPNTVYTFDFVNVTAFSAYRLREPGTTTMQFSIKAIALINEGVRVEVLHNVDAGANYDWQVSVNVMTDGYLYLQPRTTWGAFKVGGNSANATDKKIIGANQTGVGLKKGSSFVDVTLLYNSGAFERHFRNTSYNIVITKDGQIYRWDGSGIIADALIPQNFVFGYEQLLQPSEDGGVTPKSGTVAGFNDAGWMYRKIATNRHKVYWPENLSLLIGEYNDTDCVANPGYPAYDIYGSKAYQIKTRVILQDGSRINGFHRFKSIVKLDQSISEWVGWPQFKVLKKVAAAVGFAATGPGGGIGPLVPIMTSNTAPSGIAFCSGLNAADAWKVFDRNLSTEVDINA